jgi:hypothetical protein
VTETADFPAEKCCQTIIKSYRSQQWQIDMAYRKHFAEIFFDRDVVRNGSELRAGLILVTAKFTTSNACQARNGLNSEFNRAPQIFFKFKAKSKK